MNEKQILEQISEHKLVKRYKELEVVINNNEKLKEKLAKLKAMQKDMVHAETLNKPEMLKEINNSYDILYEEILNFPLVIEYLDLQKMINDFLQDFTSIIESGIKEDLS